MAEGVGNAPTSGFPDPVFGTGAAAAKAFGASLYLPAFLKWRMHNAECKILS